MQLAQLTDASAVVASTSSRLAKIARLADLLRECDAGEVAIAIGFLTGWPRQGKLGVGWAAVAAARNQPPAVDATLTLRDVDEMFSALQTLSGKGSTAGRARALGDLFSRATVEEQQFLSALLIGELRQGALEGILLESVARAFGVPPDALRRAAMIAGDLAAVAHKIASSPDETQRASALSEYALQLFRPVQPMLADSADTVADALAECGGRAALEWKLDGARIQVHRDGDRVAVYTRNLNDVTARVPEVVEAVRAFPARSLILDGEVIAMSADDTPRSFQDTMRRFGRKSDAAELRAELPLTPYFFDVLHRDGIEIIDRPLSERLHHIDAVIPERFRVPRLLTEDASEADAFRAAVVGRGHEGVMVKSLSAPYAAGRRGSAWLKVKVARTLDLVVLAVEWGSGRREGWLSNLHLGARDPDTGGFVMLGKTFKGMTDELLEWQTKELLARETRREGHIVHVRPELVVEIAFNEVQRSSQYPGGVALRFARVKGYRPDKKAEEADTIAAVRAFAT